MMITLDTSSVLRFPQSKSEGPKKQIMYKALYMWKLTGKRKVIGRDFGEIIMIKVMAPTWI